MFSSGFLILTELTSPLITFGEYILSSIDEIYMGFIRRGIFDFFNLGSTIDLLD